MKLFSSWWNIVYCPWDHSEQTKFYSLDWSTIYIKKYCVKSVRIWSYSGPYFPTFELNTERYGILDLILILQCLPHVNSKECENFSNYCVYLYDLYTAICEELLCIPIVGSNEQINECILIYVTFLPCEFSYTSLKMLTPNWKSHLLLNPMDFWYMKRLYHMDSLVNDAINLQSIR